MVSLTGRRMGLAAEWLNELLHENNLPAADHSLDKSNKQRRSQVRSFQCFSSKRMFVCNAGRVRNYVSIKSSTWETAVCDQNFSLGFAKPDLLKKRSESRCEGRLREALLNLHSDAGGQQVLALFALDKLIPLTPSHISTALEIYSRRLKIMNSESASIK